MNFMNRNARFHPAAALIVLAGLAASLPAWAHTGDLATAETTGTAGAAFAGGFVHPLLGGDHVAAMVAVGLWGAFLGAPALWLLPVVFPLIMAAGGALGVIGVPIPGIEPGIALSSVVLGLLIAFAVRMPLWAAAAIVGAFAIFHGHAHGTELPKAANPAVYSAGFVIATGLLHLAGIAFGQLTARPAGAALVRAGGIVIAAAGLGFLAGIL